MNELEKTIEKIMAICKEHKSCIGCPFDDGYKCEISFKPPTEWDKDKIESVTKSYEITY